MRRPRFLLAAVLAGAVVLGGCIPEDTTVTSTGTSAADGTSMSDGGGGGGPTEGATRAQYGEVLEIRENGELVATMSVAAPQAVESFYNGFSTPTNGPAFATFVVSVTAEKSGFTINPFDFFVRTAEGARIEPTFGCEPALNHATLNKGEKFQGCLTVDAPHGTLVYTSSLWGASLVEWPAY